MADRRRAADLHLHSTASDGLLEPAEVAALAAKRGLRAAALTDHDTVSGFAAFAAAARRRGVLPLCGAEVAVEVQGAEVHLLSYFPEAPTGGYVEILRSLAAARRGRAERMLLGLEAAGIPVSRAVLQNPVVGRPHIARELVAQGAAADTAEAFARFLSPGGAGYVARDLPTASEVVSLTHAAGGIASLAHPCRNSRDPLPSLQGVGLDAVEAVHPSADASARARLRRRAARRGLLVSGGSDFHGRMEDEIAGRNALSLSDLKRLLARLGMHL